MKKGDDDRKDDKHLYDARRGNNGDQSRPSEKDVDKLVAEIMKDDEKT